MSPLSLLFSSDEETSRRLGQTLTELEFQVEFCPEIFAAVDQLTSKSFDVIVCDWNEGAEAAFLLKSSRELKLNQNAFSVAVTRPELSAAAQKAGADLVLSKPILPDRAKYALLTCDRFLQRMRGWLPQMGFASRASDFESIPTSVPTLIKTQQSRAPRVPKPSSLLPPIPEDAKLLPVIPAFAFGSGSFGSGPRSLLGLDAGPHEMTAHRPHKPDRRLLQLAALTVAFVAVGYASSEPFRSERSRVSISKLWGQAWERTQALLHEDKRAEAPVMQVAQREPEPWHFGRSTRIQANPAPTISGPNPTGTSNPPSSMVELQSSEPPAPARPATIQPASIPRSLRASLYGGAISSVSDRVAPSLLAALEPIAVPEELSARLLLQKVAPGYPEQALRSGLQGSVVLQALIGRDGYIRDLKLIRGSFLLGKAAYQAVRQWRYQPWIVNGRAVEAETLVTVDFVL